MQEAGGSCAEFSAGAPRRDVYYMIIRKKRRTRKTANQAREMVTKPEDKLPKKNQVGAMEQRVRSGLTEIGQIGGAHTWPNKQ